MNFSVCYLDVYNVWPRFDWSQGAMSPQPWYMAKNCMKSTQENKTQNPEPSNKCSNPCSKLFTPQLFRKHKKEAEDLEKMLSKHGGSVMDEERLMISTVAADAAKKVKEVGSGKARGKSRIVQPQKTDLMGIEKVWGIGPTGLGGIKKNPLGDRTNRIV